MNDERGFLLGEGACSDENGNNKSRIRLVDIISIYIYHLSLDYIVVEGRDLKARVLTPSGPQSRFGDKLPGI